MSKFKEFFTDQHTAFWTFLGILMLPNIFMFFTESTSLLTRTVNILLPLSVFWLVTALFRKPGKAFWWLFIFYFIGAFQIVLLYLFGESPIAVDMFLNLLTTNPNEAGELLAQIYPAVIFVSVVYIGAMILSVISIRKEALSSIFRLNQRKIAVLLLVPALALTVTDWIVDKRFVMHDDIFPVNASYNVGLACSRLVSSMRYKTTSANFDPHARDLRPDSVGEVYVLVIGETLRAENLALYGYDRPTTPHLLAIADTTDCLAVYRDALTMSNTTHKSVPLLLTDIGNLEWDSLYVRKGLISAFNEAGFKTAFFSNQRRNNSFIDFLGSEAQEVKFTKDNLPLTANVYDEKLLDLLDERLKRLRPNEKLLVVLHCYGSHFDYVDRYPASIADGSDTNYPEAAKSYRRQLVNAYDNTVRYCDYILASVISRLQNRNAVMLYTSDHGEDIYDDSRNRFLHASPIPTFYHLHVPLIAWSSTGWQQRYPDKWQQMRAHASLPVSTGRVMYHTLLDLAGIYSPHLNDSSALGNKAFQAKPRLYVNDHNEYRTLDNCGLKQQDVDQFKLHGLQYP